MSEASFFSALLIGIAGGIHCIGMCGGVAAAFRAFTPLGQSPWPYTIAYNLGRITSYTLAGLVTGALGQMSTDLVPITGPILAFISGVMLIAMACYLGRWWLGLTRIEQFGRGLWQKLQPLSKRFIPFKTPFHAFPYGMIWGWLPCGLVYSTLTWALASASAYDGALIMLGFGLGTMPTLFVASAGAQWLLNGLRNKFVRQIIALSLLSYALFLIFRAINSI